MEARTGREDVDNKTTGSLSWLTQLQAYLQAYGVTHDSQRKMLADMVMENPASPEAWLCFLEAEEAASVSEMPKTTVVQQQARSMALYRLYHKATELVQRGKGRSAEAFVNIWLGYARFQWQHSEDEARDTFKALKNQHIGDANAQLFHMWAKLEATSGHDDKALAILNKALKGGAQPARILEDLRLALLSKQDDIPANNACGMSAVSKTGRLGCADFGTTAAGGAVHLHAETAKPFAPSLVLQPQHQTATIHSAGTVTTHSSSRSLTGGTQGLGLTGSIPSKSQAMSGASDEDLTVSNSDTHSNAGHREAGQHTIDSTEAMLAACQEGDLTLRTLMAQREAQINREAAGNLTGPQAGGGIKRFGFKSKALRVVGANAAGTSAGHARQEAAAAAATDAAPGQVLQQLSLPQQSAGASLQPSLPAAEESEDQEGTRKRRADTPVSQSPPNPSSVLPDGTKRRTSPDNTGLRAGCSQLPASGTGAMAMHTSKPASMAVPGTAELPAGVHMAAPHGNGICSTPGANGADAIGKENRCESTGPADGSKLDMPKAQAQLPMSAQPASRAVLQPVQPQLSGLSAPMATMRPQQEPDQQAHAQLQGAGSRQVPGLQHDSMGSSTAAAGVPPPGSEKTASSSAQAPAAAGITGAPPERLAEPQKRAMEDANWVYVSGLRYQKLDCVGRGGSSKVFKVLGCNRQIYALKRVRFANKDPEAIRGFIDEISLLKQLRNTPNIIQLISAQVFRDEGLIYMVLEYGDIDLAHLLHNHEEARQQRAAGSQSAAGPSGNHAGEIDDNFIRLYWQQMLQAVHGIHELRIVHSDLKPANFLLVQGQLKLIDFGIAKSIQGDTTSIARESQVGTLNYMSPEAIQGGSSNPLGGEPMKVGRASDVWSLGCILYQMIYGRTPFADLPFIPKMNAICNSSYQINFPPCSNPAAVDVIRRCLDRNPRTRITIQELLGHAFLHPERAAPAATAHTRSQDLGALSEQHLKSIVSQIAQAGANGTADIDSLTRQVLAHLSASCNTQPGTSSIDTAQPSSRQLPAPPPPPAKAPPPPPPPPPALGLPKPPAPVNLCAPAKASGGPASPTAGTAPADPLQGSSQVALAAAAAAQRRDARLTEKRAHEGPAEPRPAASGPGPGMGMLMGAELQAAIMQKRTQLRPVAPAGSVQAAAGRAAPPHQPVQGGARPLQRQCTSADAGQETMDFMQEVKQRQAGV